ncbi:hypothetical protein V8E36_008822 [Tilletia maclaganii]
MICPAFNSPELIRAATPFIRDDNPPGTVHHLYRDGSAGHTIRLFRQSHSRAHSESRSEADLHAYVKAEVDRVTNKYSAIGFKYFVETRSNESLLQERTTGRVPLTPVRNGMAWIGVISVGTGCGEVPLTANFDTGSSDVIILPGQYDPTRSTSARHTAESFQLTFVDSNNVQGSVILETVQVAGLEARNVPIRHAITSTLNSGGFQSLIGMASLVSPATSTRRQLGLIPKLLEQGCLQYNLFGFGLWQDARALLDLGCVPRQYRGQISWTDIINPEEGFWTCGFGISGLAGAQSAVVDTGTSMITGPMDLVRTVLLQAGMQTYERNGILYGLYRSDGPTPHISISIAGIDLVLSAQSMAYKNRGEFTLVGIAGRRGTSGWWVLGGVFLQNVYAVFDGEALRIGFAPH